MKNDPGEMDIFGAKLTRRSLFQSGGGLAVGFALLDVSAQAQPARALKSLDPTLAKSWIDIHPDNTITIRSGKPDFGQGTPYTAYRQIAAEELYTTFDAVTTIVEGHTDVTPDGSGAFSFLGIGSPNMRKVAAYTFQALLELAAQHFNTAKTEIKARDGVMRFGAQTIAYGDLVKARSLDLKIPVTGSLYSKAGLIVTGNPPTKPVADYTVIGRSHPNSMIAAKVQGSQVWTADVALPGMLHARIIHPKGLGSTLIRAGAVDRKRFPNSRVVTTGNLVAVVAPDEWEAIQASNQVARDTTWTEWTGIPPSDELFSRFRAMDWTATPEAKSGKSKGDVPAALTSAPKRLRATYELPYVKHAPIGPAVAVGDVRDDGSITVHAASQNPQSLREQIARMMGAKVEDVVVRGLPGAGQFGRSNGGNGGAEDDAVILSKLLGKPVRVQWMREGDVQWSPQSTAAVADIEISISPDGRMTGYLADHYMPALNDDRPLGAVLAGLPTMPAPSVNRETNAFTSTVNTIQDAWLYDTVPALLERGHGAPQISQADSPTGIGVRCKSMRTPGQLQQNFARECAINEAARLAGADPIAFRISHATDARLINVLTSVRDAVKWDAPLSHPASEKQGNQTLRYGRGVSCILRHGAYWACVCEVSVDTASGTVRVLKYTAAVDPGIVINPLQLQRQVEGGAVMGISQALFEEVKFDDKGVTSRDWISYPILTMADLPEIEAVLLHRPEQGAYGGGSEAANALAPPAIIGAVLDATGRAPRRLPLTPANVLVALNG